MRSTIQNDDPIVIFGESDETSSHLKKPIDHKLMMQKDASYNSNISNSDILTPGTLD